ncbi:hypothetical protein JW826_00340 [Candidatus Woesearchaeota archaeon]|nr:hypothetical protein [Candidatus Woesearchaeota archaeon]
MDAQQTPDANNTLQEQEKQENSPEESGERRGLEDYISLFGVKRKRARKLLEGLSGAVLTQEATHQVERYRCRSEMRSKILRRGALGLVACILTASMYKVLTMEGDPPVTSTNAYVESFPTQIEGAGSVEKYNPLGAKRVLTHIRQIHNHPDYDLLSLTDNMRADRDHFDKTIDVQDDISRIIPALRQKLGVSAIYVEGLSDRFSRADYVSLIQKQKEALAALKEQSHKLDVMRSRLGENPIWLEAGAQVILNQRSYLLVELLQGSAILGSGMEVNFSGRKSTALALSEAESELKEKERLYLLGKCGFLEKRRYEIRVEDLMMRQREDDLLQIILDNGDKTAFVIFGGAHDWQDNVDSWNHTHPDERFAYVRITPAHYR